MTEKELQKWMLKEKLADSWKVSLDGSIFQELMTLSKVFQICGLEAHSDLQVLHESQVDVEKPPWIELDPESGLALDEREAIRGGLLGSDSAFIVSLAVLLGLIALGGLTYALWPEDKPAPPRLEPLDAMMAKLGSHISGQEATSAKASLPELKVNVALSGRLIYVSNLSDEVWPSCRVYLNDYYYQWNVEVDSLRTLQAPLRLFRDGKETFQLDAGKSFEVKVVVPGYEPWLSHLR